MCLLAALVHISCSETSGASFVVVLLIRWRRSFISRREVFSYLWQIGNTWCQQGKDAHPINVKLSVIVARTWQGIALHISTALLNFNEHVHRLFNWLPLERNKQKASKYMTLCFTPRLKNRTGGKGICMRQHVGDTYFSHLPLLPWT